MSTQFEPGAPAPDGIPLCAPVIQGKEWTYIKECLDTGWVSSAGAFVARFERELAAYVGAAHAVATASGTAALHIALLVAGVEPDDEVITSPLSFIAPANAIRYVGAWPVFVDVEPGTWQMDPAQVAHFLERECIWRRGALVDRRTGRRVRAILPVHILGHPVDMDPILALARRYELTVIEDATESLGARYRGRPVGTLGDAACFSFNGNKLITTGGGGMLVTDRRDWAERARYLTTQAKDDPLEYVHKEIGYNYRLTNVQAAMGCAQLEQIDHFIAAKRRIAKTYRAALGPMPGVCPMPQAPWAESVHWLYTILLEPSLLAARSVADSRDLLRFLARRNIQSRPLWQPLHLSPAHRASYRGPLPVAEDIQRRALSLPCSVDITPQELDRVTATIREWCSPPAAPLHL